MYQSQRVCKRRMYYGRTEIKKYFEQAQAAALIVRAEAYPFIKTWNGTRHAKYEEETMCERHSRKSSVTLLNGGLANG